MKKLIESFDEYFSREIKLNEKSTLNTLGITNDTIRKLYSSGIIISNEIETAALGNKTKVKNMMQMTNHGLIAIKASDDLIVIKNENPWSTKRYYTVYSIKGTNVATKYSVSISNALDFLTSDYTKNMYEIVNDHDPSRAAKDLGRGDANPEDINDEHTYILDYMGDEYNKIIASTIESLKAAAVQMIIPALESYRTSTVLNRNGKDVYNIKYSKGVASVEDVLYSIANCNYLLDVMNGIIKDTLKINIHKEAVIPAQYVFNNLVLRKYKNYSDFDDFFGFDSGLTAMEKKNITRTEVSKFLNSLSWEDLMEK